MDVEDLQFGTITDSPPANNFNSTYYLPSTADCMRCGACLSSCPTYSLSGMEEETPRSRIRSLDKVLNNNRPLSSKERQHLDSCLQCRACETVCTGKMEYGRLFDETQHKLAGYSGLIAQSAFWLIEHKRWRFYLLALIWLYSKTGLAKPLQKSGLLKRLGLQEAAELVSTPALAKLQTFYSAGTAQTKGKVGLLTGCLAESFDRKTLLGTINLLTRLGFDVFIPAEQSCCGAIHQHNKQSAKKLIDNNIAVFQSLGLDYIIFTATGCGAMLSEYSHHNENAGQSFCGKLMDINEFVLAFWPDELKLKPANLKIAVHEPCSQRNVLKNQKAVYELLAKIPGINLSPLRDNHLCCGAGGSYMLTHPETAAALRKKKLGAMADIKADFVVSSNYGCYAFMNQPGTEVIHPIELLARQMG